MEKQFTASVYIIQEEKVLLLLHPKLNKWLPPGGHLEPNEIPPAAAKREVLEETGLEIEWIRDEHVWIEQWNAQSFERPWMCLLENIPAYRDQPPHYHVDFIYLARPIGGAITPHHEQMHPIRWFTQQEIATLPNIFLETQQVIEKIFSWTKCGVLTTS